MYCTFFTDEIAVVHTVFDQSETFEESTGAGIDVKHHLYDGIPLIQALKIDPSSFDKSDCEFSNMC